jgi:hypothetical protein
VKYPCNILQVGRHEGASFFQSLVASAVSITNAAQLMM